jgi:hypothetical protein
MHQSTGAVTTKRGVRMPWSVPGAGEKRQLCRYGPRHFADELSSGVHVISPQLLTQVTA